MQTYLPTLEVIDLYEEIKSSEHLDENSLVTSKKTNQPNMKVVHFYLRDRNEDKIPNFYILSFCFWILRISI